MNKTNIIINNKSKQQSGIDGGSPTNKGVIYAARCTKHDIIYIGQTGDPLNHRFNRHRSDTTLYPDRCELPKHFSNNTCDFNKDLEISILENVKGSAPSREYKEDQWIMRLDTCQPNGLNVHISDFGSLYSLLIK